MGFQKIKKDTIHIPTNLSGDIDYNFIEVFSKAIEKFSIISVVEWKDRIIETTRTVVSQNTKNWSKNNVNVRVGDDSFIFLLYDCSWSEKFRKR